MSWTEIPGGMTTSLPPAMVIGADGDLFVFAVGTDQGIYVNHKSGGAWQSSWTKIPDGRTTCAVYAVADSLGDVAVTITGLDSKFYVSQRSREDGTWSAWQSLDGGAGSSPTTIAGVNDTKQFAYVFAGNNTHIYTDGGTYAIAL